jgi:hypothetical protein
MHANAYPIVWLEDEQPLAAGRLELADRHAVLSGVSRGVERHSGFVAQDVEAAELVSDPAHRLNRRPTLEIALADHRRLLIGEATEFGVVADVAAALEEWRKAPRS